MLSSLAHALRRRWWLIALIGVLVLAILALWRSVRLSSDPFWERIQETGKWRVAMDPSFPPFEDLDDSGRPVGFDVDLADAIAARWGVEVQIEGIGFDGLIDAVWASRVDAVISALPLQPQFSKDVAFSQSYFEAGLVLVVPVDAMSIDGVQDLLAAGGRRIAVEWGSEGDVQARNLRRQEPDIEVLPLESPLAALTAVAAGEADAALVDNISALQYTATGAQVRIAPEVVVSEPYVIVMPRKAPELQRQVGEALGTLRADGSLDALVEKWFAPAP
jgi:ABC-type amino acid transport substrate-binding protein